MLAANRIGGYLVGMDFIQSTPGAPAGKKLKIILNTNVDGSIYVDKRGNRIVDEGARRDVIRDAVLGTPERYAYTVVDNNQYNSYNSAVHDAVERGIAIDEAWTAPTIKELAKKMGVDPEGLQKTIDRYNNVLIKNNVNSISGTPVVVKHFRIKFFFSLAKQDLFPYFFGCLGILFEVKCVCCCIQKRPIYQSLQAVSRTSIDSICLP